MNSPAADAAAQTLIVASLSDLDGRSRMISRWRGKVLVVNFWATWCAPCREEIPALMNVQHVYAANGVQFVGIAIDNISKVRDYAAAMHIDYVLLIGGMGALVLSKDLGNRASALPFTVVLDRSGKVVYTHAGAVTEAILDPILQRLL
jgi:thiol-disulfide isomerase/thioredoxin